MIGEIAAGLLLGPSFLGQLWPAAAAFVFPELSLDVLRLLSQVGVILFMFSVGLDVDVTHLRQRAPTAIAVSHFSIVVPFLLGVGAALVLFPHYAPAGVPFHSFALFMGIALSITAFPVLARVIEERGLTRTPLGSTALACAAVDDVTAWVLLAMVVTLVTAGGIGGTLALMVCALGDLHGGHGVGGAAVARARARAHERRAQPWADGARADRAAGVGAPDGGHRHPRALRCVSRRRDHAAERGASPAAARAARELELGVPAADLFCFHGTAHRDRPAERRRELGGVRGHHPDGGRRQAASAACSRRAGRDRAGTTRSCSAR